MGITDRLIKKEDARCNVLLYGKYGSGKTFTALQLALALGKKVAVLDTEGKRTAVYLGRFQFDSFDISDTHDPRKYAEFIKEVDALGYDVIILDSISEAWDGPNDGVLAQAEANDKKGLLKWQGPKRSWGDLMSVLRQTKARIIVTAKEKEQFDAKTNKLTGEIIPIMEKNTPYWFDLVLRMESNQATLEKFAGTTEHSTVGTVLDKPDGEVLVRMYKASLGQVEKAKAEPKQIPPME